MKSNPQFLKFELKISGNDADDITLYTHQNDKDHN